jgi:NAD(P)-dependent dehydrogenase (short-subunit alcohol dehydrogenase family)
MAQLTGDLTGTVCLITGATSGIGKAAAVALARRGSTLVLVGRDQDRGERTVEEIVNQTGNRQVDLMLADLSSQEQIRQLAERFLATERPLHILLNNAGIIMLRRRETVDGIETTLAVNHLGCFLLTSLLLERIKASAPARIVNVASDAYGHAGGRLDFGDLQSVNGYSAMKVYGKSKLANILFTRELARRLQGTGVTANCLHPGFVGTNLARNNGLVASAAMLLLRPFARSPDKGAETVVYLCASPEVAGVTGKYFFDKQEKWPKRYAQNDEDAARLWEVSECMTGLTGGAHLDQEPSGLP